MSLSYISNGLRKVLCTLLHRRLKRRCSLFSFCFHQYNVTALWQETHTNRERVKQIIEKVLGKLTLIQYIQTLHLAAILGKWLNDHFIQLDC